MSSGPLRTPDRDDTPASNVASWDLARRLNRSLDTAPIAPTPTKPGKPPPGKKHRAKRFNEQLKAFYGYMNALAAAVIVTGFITPTVRHEAFEWGWGTVVLFVASLGLHCIGQAALFFLTRPEE